MEEVVGPRFVAVVNSYPYLVAFEEVAIPPGGGQLPHGGGELPCCILGGG